MVLEGVVATVLNKVLSEFIENVDPKQLQISVASGRLLLEHLRMKDTAFDRFGLPLRLRFGSIGRLTLIVPSWIQPFSKPWRAELEQLYCIVVPCMSVEYNEKEEARIALERKLAEINRLELALSDGNQVCKIKCLNSYILVGIFFNLISCLFLFYFLISYLSFVFFDFKFLLVALLLTVLQAYNF